MFRHIALWSFPSLMETLAKTVSLGIVIGLLSQLEFGYLSMGMLIFSYAGYAQLGVTDALALRLPDLYIQKKADEFNRSLSGAISFTLVVMMALGTAFSAVAIYLIDQHILLTSLAAYCITSVLYQIYYHYLLANRYTYNFILIAKARVSIALIRLSLQLIAVCFYGIYGFLAIEVVLYLYPILLFVFKSKIRLCMHFDGDLIKDLLKTGFPLVVIGVLSVIAMTIDRWFVVYEGGASGLAVYSVVAYMGAIIAIFPNQILSLFSQYCREFLAQGNEKAKILDLFLTITLVIVVCWSVASYTVMHLGHLLINEIWQHYNECLELLSGMAVLCLLRIVIGAYNHAYIIMDRKKYTLIAHVFGLVMTIGCCASALWIFDYGLLGVVWARNISAFAQMNLLVAMGVFRFNTNKNKYFGLLVILAVSLLVLLSGSTGSLINMGVLLDYLILLIMVLAAVAVLYKSGDLQNLMYIVKRQYAKEEARN